MEIDMKIAVTVAGSEAKESAFVVWRGFKESIKKASECGYDGVELALKDARRTLKSLVADLRLYICHVNDN